MPSMPVIKPLASADSGTLFVVATPIGNLGDITLRALEVLRTVDLIAAEDTRHTRKLLSFYAIHKPLISCRSNNMRECSRDLLEKMGRGAAIALVTDAGTPGISDPGTLLVQQALERNFPVAVIPGPTALISSLVASGLPTHPFAFLGFPPSRGAGRKRFFSSHAGLVMTLILYESPQRLLRTLEDMLRFWGDRRIAVARELTKKFEEVFRGTIAEAIEYYGEGTRGELTLVVEGAGEEQTRAMTQENWQEELAHLLEDSRLTVKLATEEIHRRHRLSRRLVYRKALEIRNSNIETRSKLE
jgi:16S rRNA (cytidine1402-2'-O)-methyltransferase